MRVFEQNTPVHLIEPANYGSAGIDADSVNMGLALSLAATFLFGAIVGNSTLKAYSGASAGVKTTALAFKYRLSSADFKAANADQLGAATAVASTGLSLVAATFDHREVVVEIDADQMTDGEKWLTFEIDNVATTLNVAALGVLAARYAGASIPTAV